MPCCCQNNVQAALVLGILFVIFSLLSCVGGKTENITIGIIGALINGILVFGAYTRNSTAILVWMILGVLECIGLIVVVIITTIFLISGNATGIFLGGGIFAIIICVGMIFFCVWTHIVANNARKEIHESQTNV